MFDKIPGLYINDKFVKDFKELTTHYRNFADYLEKYPVKSSDVITIVEGKVEESVLRIFFDNVKINNVVLSNFNTSFFFNNCGIETIYINKNCLLPTISRLLTNPNAKIVISNENIFYKLKNGVLYEIYDLNSSDLIVRYITKEAPEELVLDKRAVAIGENACSNAKIISLYGENVKILNSESLADSKTLKEFHFPKLETIEDMAFYHTDLKDMTFLSDSVKCLSTTAFSCSNFKKVILLNPELRFMSRRLSRLPSLKYDIYIDKKILDLLDNAYLNNWAKPITLDLILEELPTMVDINKYSQILELDQQR